MGTRRGKVPSEIFRYMVERESPVRARTVFRRMIFSRLDMGLASIVWSSLAPHWTEHSTKKERWQEGSFRKRRQEKLGQHRQADGNERLEKTWHDYGQRGIRSHGVEKISLPSRELGKFALFALYRRRNAPTSDGFRDDSDGFLRRRFAGLIRQVARKLSIIVMDDVDQCAASLAVAGIGIMTQ